jgi:predicted ester cyclase
MSNEANKETVIRYFNETWNLGHLDKESEYISSSVVVHAPPPPGERVWLLQLSFIFRAAMPDFVILDNVLFGDGDRVVQRWIITGTHSGAELYGAPASGKKLTVSGVNIFRIVEGIIVERWSTWDMAGLMQQLRPN